MKKICALTLSLMLTTTAVVSTGCGKVDRFFASDYVSATLDASYKGDLDKYIELTDATKEEAQNLYDSTVDYYVSYITIYCDIDSDYLSEETYASYTALAQDLLKKSKYEVATSENGKESCYVTVTIEPIDILNQAEEAIEGCIDDYQARLEALSEEELDEVFNNDDVYAEYEETYALDVLKVLQDSSSNLTYGESVTTTMQILVESDKDGNNLYGPANEDDWDTIDDYIMNIS